MSKKHNITTKGFYPLVVLLVFFASFTHASEQNERKKILVLFSFLPTMPVAVEDDDGSKFKDSTTRPYG